MTEMLTQKRNTGSWMSALTNSPMSNCIGIFRVRKLTMELTMLEKVNSLQLKINSKCNFDLSFNKCSFFQSMHRKISREITKENQQTPNFVISFILSLQTESSKTCLSWNNAAFVFHKGLVILLSLNTVVSHMSIHCISCLYSSFHVQVFCTNQNQNFEPARFC